MQRFMERFRRAEDLQRQEKKKHQNSHNRFTGRCLQGTFSVSELTLTVN